DRDHPGRAGILSTRLYGAEVTLFHAGGNEPPPRKRMRSRRLPICAARISSVTSVTSPSGRTLAVSARASERSPATWARCGSALSASVSGRGRTLPRLDDPLPRFIDDAAAAKLLRAARAQEDPFARLTVEFLARTGLRRSEFLN